MEYIISRTSSNHHHFHALKVYLILTTAQAVQYIMLLYCLQQLSSCSYRSSNLFSLFTMEILPHIQSVNETSQQIL